MNASAASAETAKPLMPQGVEHFTLMEPINLKPSAKPLMPQGGEHKKLAL
jgi:hypothetical protein